MWKRIVKFLMLVAVAVLFWAANYRFNILYFTRGFQTLIAIALIYFVFKVVLEEVVSRGIKDARSQYSFRRTMSIIYYVAIVVAIIAIWVRDTQTLLVSYGLVAAGIAVTLQDVFKSFAGGVIIFATGTYKVGERIEIGGKFGDVIDIGIMYTTLLEIKEWVQGDQPTGRIITMPNSSVLNNPVNNYTSELSFIFEDMSIPITYDSNWKKATEEVLAIVRRETEQVAAMADEQLHAMRRRFYVEKRAVEPAIFLTITDNWINLNIRFPTVARERRITRSRISTAILEMIEASDDIKVASATVEIVGFPPVKMKTDALEK
ncbi:mechanosensitive ion channel family protein [Methanocella sp. MCL-LM]|uniref:mechanosensitive ion channel family protein n=1 Tax=Methanocella sp. MCL-LM TaxID=3412035 RepID=UPI003C787927